MTQTVATALQPVLGESLASYLRAVNAAPLLSAERERELALRYHNDNDIDAARELVLSHLRYVVKVARGFMGYGLPLPDLIQEGSIGLMKAVKRFDPSREVRLVSFAVHWIRAEIYDYIVRNWRIVKVATTKSQRKLFFNLRKSRARLGWIKQHEVDKLADELAVDKSVVREMESRLSGRDIAFNTSFNGDGDEVEFSPEQHLGDSTCDPAVVVDREQHTAQVSEQLKAAFARLDKRSREIVQRRWLGDKRPTLHALADEYGVSAERIRQIEKRAMEKMKAAIDV